MAARTEITVQQLPENGAAFSTLGQIAFTAGDSTNGMKFKNSGREMIILRNGNAATRTATVLGVRDENGRTGNVVLTAPAFATPVDGIAYGGPYPEALFGSDLEFDLDADTNLSIAVVRLPGRI